PANASIAQGTATVTITDDDLPPKLSMLNAASVTEGGTGVTTPMTYTVTLDAPSGKTVTVDWATSGGTATPGADYTATNGTVTFTPGETSHPVSVDVIGDALDEPNETVKVVVSNPVNAVIGVGTTSGTITDDDPK